MPLPILRFGQNEKIWEKEMSDPTIELSPNAITVLERRYLRKNQNSEVIETPEQMFRRVSQAIAEIEREHDTEADTRTLADKFFRLMAQTDFLPNSPTLMNAGTELGQLAACFVLPVDDDMTSIFEAVKNTALIHQSGGGTGFSFSRLRPAGDVVRSTGGIASGPISFMRVFDGATDVIKQGGRRRGANMGILDVTHPDILDFIECKATEGKFPNFNLSVGVTDAFMRAVEKDTEYELINPRTQKVAKKLSARQVFDKIAEMAYRNGEPGIIFIDRMNAFNPTPKLGKYESTNPCGEQVLLPNESCNLGSINLANMLVHGQIDWKKLEKTVKGGVHFLDNVISANRYPLPVIEEMTLKTRKIGLGVMGFADVLIALGVAYDSEEAIELARTIMEAINYWSKEASVELAQKRGAFPAFEGSIYQYGHLPIPNPTNGASHARDRMKAPLFDWDALREKIKKHGIRNATTTTIAPTGSISIIAGVSSGIEPLFALAYTRNVMDNDRLVEVNKMFRDVAEEGGFASDELFNCLAQGENLQNIDGIPDEVKRRFVTAMNISVEWHIKMQAAFQSFTDNAVSKTINAPNSATEEDVRQAYLLAYHEGCKGLTVYRDGSREVQVLTRGSKEKKSDQEAAPPSPRIPRPRPSVVHGVTQKVQTGCGGLFITINEDENGLFEVFANMGKGGGCAASQTEATGRLISTALRSGVDVESIIEQLRGIRCPKPAFDGGSVVFSCSDAIAKALERYVRNGEQNGEMHEGKQKAREMAKAKLSKSNEGIRPDCPDCGAVLHFVEGCAVCTECGFSECG